MRHPLEALAPQLTSILLLPTAERKIEASAGTGDKMTLSINKLEKKIQAFSLLLPLQVLAFMKFQITAHCMYNC